MIERPKGWHAPAKNYGGENMTEFYARMVVDEVVAIMFSRTKNLDLPIGAGVDELMAQKDEVEARLRARNIYFHEPSGSIFTDYKIMRDEALRKKGREMGKDDLWEAEILGYSEQIGRFSSSMSTVEALQLARIIVESWDWEE